MFTQSPSLPNFVNTLERINTSDIKADGVLFQLIIESFFDGILILTEQGEWLEANDFARHICTQLTPFQSPPNSIPKEIWHVCLSLLKSSSSCSQSAVSIESEITTNQSLTLRIRVQWLKLYAMNRPCLLVILEDRSQALQNLAISEVEKYGLTPREAEVWLLSRANYTRQEIAAELGISLNTVKKHLKSIHAKRKTVFYLNECYS